MNQNTLTNDVYIQDQTSEIVDVFFMKNLGSVTLNSNAVLDSKTFDATAGHGIQVGDMMRFKQGTHFRRAYVTGVAGNTITIDTPFDFAFTTTADVHRGSTNMNVDGSVTPQIFEVSPVGLDIDIDITRLFFHILDDVVMDDGKFGGISKLTNGVFIRKKDGVYKNIFNVKTNGDFANHCELVQYQDKAPSGQYGFRAIRSFAGQHNNGVAIRLKASDGDMLQIVIQDNLTGLLEFHAICQGHVVQK